MFYQLKKVNNLVSLDVYDAPSGTLIDSLGLYESLGWSLNTSSLNTVVSITAPDGFNVNVAATNILKEDGTACADMNEARLAISAVVNFNVGGVKFQKLKVVTSPEDLQNIDSTVLYLIDGVIDFTGTGLNIEVPATGISFVGHTFDVSRLICSDNNYTMFTSPVGGSGNVLFEKVDISASGSNSKVFALTDATGFNAFEFNTVNFTNCTSLGYIDSYRQGLELGTGRFVGTPTLELRGTWIGGYRINTSIVRALAAGMTEPLFKAGAGFVMNNRFASDFNVDLPASAALLDFAPSNFGAKGLLQLKGCNISRNGVFDNSDANLTPNVSATDDVSNWKDNKGLPNTIEGGLIEITVEAVTTILSTSEYYFLEGTYTASYLDHFDMPVNGQLRYTGGDMVTKFISGNFNIKGTQNDAIDLQIEKSTDDGVTWSAVYEKEGVINNLAGGRNVAFINFTSIPVELSENDRIRITVENYTNTNDVTGELGTSLIIN